MIDVLELAADPDLYQACISVSEEGVARPDVLLSILGEQSAVDDFLTSLRLQGLALLAFDQILPTKDLDLFLALAQGISTRNPRDIVDAIQLLYPELARIKVLRDDLTGSFFDFLGTLRTAGHISICSPWINISPNQFDVLRALVSRSIIDGEPYSLSVVTRPASPRERHYSSARESIHKLAEIGVEVVPLKNLHAKLYIRTASASLGTDTAVIGSQNLTPSRYAELGLLIRDDRRLIRELQAAFFEIARSTSTL